MTFTVEEQAVEVETLIQDFVWAEHRPETPEHHTLAVLKAVAKDLRGRMPGRPTAAEREVERRVAVALASKRPGGYEAGPLIGLGQSVIGCWPTLKQGLELLREREREEATS